MLLTDSNNDWKLLMSNWKRNFENIGFDIEAVFVDEK